jgi:hypothetical protein
VIIEIIQTLFIVLIFFYVSDIYYMLKKIRSAMEKEGADENHENP